MADRYNWFNVGCSLVKIAVFIVLLVPLGVAVVISFNNVASLSFPPHGLSPRWYTQVVGDLAIQQAFPTSLAVAITVGLIATLIGVAAGYGLGRYRFFGRSTVLGLIVLPIVLPGLLLAMGLVLVFTTFGIQLSMWTLAIGHVTLTLPFAILIVATQTLTLDRRLEDASRVLGASWVYTIRRVVLPALAPAIRGAFLFSMVISFNEVILAIFLSGTDHTLPAYMFSEFNQVLTPEFDAISTSIVALAIALLVFERFAIRRMLSRTT